MRKYEEIFKKSTKDINGYIGFYPGIGEELCLDGWFTKEQLRTILAALDKADSIEAAQLATKRK